jgi:hypothetical protein
MRQTGRGAREKEGHDDPCPGPRSGLLRAYMRRSLWGTNGIPARSDRVLRPLRWWERCLKFAVCLDGQNACPPEDCGGPSGYEALLAALADPANDEHDSMLLWMGGPFDASGFSLADANAALQRGPLSIGCFAPSPVLSPPFSLAYAGI